MNTSLNVTVDAAKAHSLLSAFEELTTSRSHNLGTINVVKSDAGGIAQLQCVNHHFWPWNRNSTVISKDMVLNLREALHQVVNDELMRQFEVIVRNADPGERKKIEEKTRAVLEAFDKAINKGDDEGDAQALSRVEISKLVGNVKLLRSMTSVDALLQFSDRDLALLAARESMTPESRDIVDKKDASYSGMVKSAQAFDQAKALIGDSLLSDKDVLELGQTVFDKAFPGVTNLRRRAESLSELSERCHPQGGRTSETAADLASKVNLMIEDDDLDDWADDPSKRTLNKDLGEKARCCLEAYNGSKKRADDIETFFKDMTAILEEQQNSPQDELEKMRETLEKAGATTLRLDDRGRLVAGTKEDFIKLLDAFSTHNGGDAGVGEGFDDETRAKVLEDFVKGLEGRRGVLAAQKKASENVEDVGRPAEPAEPSGSTDELRQSVDGRLNKIRPFATDFNLLLSSAGERIMEVVVPVVNEIRAEADDGTRRSRLAGVNEKMQERYPSLAFEDDGTAGVRLASVPGKSREDVLNDVKAMFRDFALGTFPYDEFKSRRPARDDAIKFVDAFAYDVGGARPHFADVLRTDYASLRELELENSPDYADTENGGVNLSRLEADIKTACRGKHFRETFAYAIDRFVRKCGGDYIPDGELNGFVETLKALKVMFNTVPAKTAQELCGKVIDNIEASSPDAFETRNVWGDKEEVAWCIRGDLLQTEVKKVLHLVEALYGKNVKLP